MSICMRIQIKAKKQENDRNLRLGGIIGLMGWLQLKVPYHLRPVCSEKGSEMEVSLAEIGVIEMKIIEEIFS